jgi:DNA-binding MarR family transcriptional regulator
VPVRAQRESRAGRPSVEPETFALRALQEAVGDAELALARRMHLNPTDLSAMGHLAFAEESLGTGELTGRLGISPAATTELVDRLERAGHVLRRRDEKDRRRVRLTPSPSATAEVLSHLGPLLSALDEVVEDVPERDREAIRRYLAAVTEVYRTWAAGGVDGPAGDD